VLFTHVSDSMSVTWGQATGTGLVSVEYTFEGQAAHGAGDPWKGRSALDAVELMNVGWNFRREHLRPLQRSHYVIVDGGDQPNVVPSKATVWYFIREITAEHIRENFAALQRMADGAAMMTDTTVSQRIIGTAYPRHFNKPIAEAMHENMQAVGMPDWSRMTRLFARVSGVHGRRRNPAAEVRDRRARRTPGRAQVRVARTTSATSPGMCLR
jgi:aminobenzoyl-glutamate utilization protein B